MDHLLIMNPGSCSGHSRRRFKRIFDLLDKAGIRYRYQTTSSLADARAQSVAANQKGIRNIIAVGGDGTINRVINGFFDEKGNRNSESKLGIIYTGTSPDFCKSYNIPTGIKKAVRVIARNQSKRISIGKIQFSRTNIKSASGRGIHSAGHTATRYFGCCANIGLGAMVAKRANSGIRTYLGDVAGTFVSLLKTLAEYRPGSHTVVMDGRKYTVENLYNLSVGRTSRIASGIKVPHNLEDGDGKLYCMQVSNLKLTDIPALIKKVYGGKPFRNNPYLTMSYCRRIEIHGHYQNPEIEFDGDPGGYLPCRIELARDPLEILAE